MVDEGVPIVTQRVTYPANIHEDAYSIPGLTQWVEDLAMSCGIGSSNSTPSLGTSICRGCGQRKKERKMDGG